jgi:hypothetical protein
MEKRDMEYIYKGTFASPLASNQSNWLAIVAMPDRNL